MSDQPPIDERYEQGYRDGENSGSADWSIALGEVLPAEVDEWDPSAVAAYIEATIARVEAVRWHVLELHAFGAEMVSRNVLLDIAANLARALDVAASMRGIEPTEDGRDE